VFGPEGSQAVPARPGVKHMIRINSKLKIQYYKGYIRAKCLTLQLRGLHVNHVVQRAIWVPTQHFLWDHGKP
jgi:hypothetical protein